MPGSPSSFLNTGSAALTKMLNTPIPGQNSAGFDTLSTGYDSAETTGMSDIASRGLTTTGAVPSMYRDLGNEYTQGAGQVVAQGAAEKQQQKLQILNALLGLGSAGLNLSRANTGSEFETAGLGEDIGTGIFGPAPTPGGPGLGSLMSAPNLRNLLSSLF
jgi:hypothetical protein